MPVRKVPSSTVMGEETERFLGRGSTAGRTCYVTELGLRYVV
jgi:hypothetical protein